MSIFTPKDIEVILKKGLKPIVGSKNRNDDNYDMIETSMLLEASKKIYKKTIKNYSELGAIGVAIVSIPVINFLGMDRLGPDGIKSNSDFTISISEKYLQDRYKNHIWRAIKCAAGMARHITVDYGLDHSYSEIINDIIAGIVCRDRNDENAFEGVRDYA